MQLGSLFEVIVYCRDMQAQVAFYREQLGLSITWPTGLADYSDEHWVSFATAGATLALHSGGEAPQGTPPRFGFRVGNLAHCKEELTSRGVACGEIRQAAPGILVLDCRDPEGNGFFLEQQSH
jgi:catechol 2,3-dioxygenase-like lactoylglutathione lyase family enzyme